MITVTVRSVQQNVADFDMAAEPDMLVSSLKQHLCEKHSLRPDASRQRLICAGHLMADDKKLSDYIRPEMNDKCIIHLVCSIPVHSLPSCSNTDNSDAGVRLRRHLPSSAPAAVAEQHPSTSVFACSPTNANSLGPVSATAPVLDSAGWLNVHSAMMNEYMQYMSRMYGSANWPYMYAGGLYSNTAAISTGLEESTATVTDVLQQQSTAAGATEPPAAEEAAPAAALARRPAAPARQQVLNAQGGVDDEDDEHPRDWLDWIYMGSRACLLFMVLYFYSSLERFVFVIFCCMIMYIMQQRWRLLRQPVANRVQEPGPPNVPQQNAGFNQAAAPEAVNNRDQRDNLQLENAEPAEIRDTAERANSYGSDNASPWTLPNSAVAGPKAGSEWRKVGDRGEVSVIAISHSWN
ncbi:unnamed protein product [Soboliphyme baturini]|uniref:Ubiquitin-like domain-containing protein n=1 Tax=Soboliphyme baturini TaxID=241478 RepID=A0A183IQA1_9BILA|nr:unnamed protein product [Soboliphyme baturini]